MSDGKNTKTAVLEPVDEDSFRLQATDVTGTQRVEAFGVARSTPAGVVASALASQMQLPEDVPWVLRDDATSAYLEETLPIGDQIESDTTVTITPKTPLG